MNLVQVYDKNKGGAIYVNPELITMVRYIDFSGDGRIAIYFGDLNSLYIEVNRDHYKRILHAANVSISDDISNASF